MKDRPVYLRRWPVGQWVIAALGVIVMLAALWLVNGTITGEFTFLGELAPYSGVIVIGLVGSAVLLAFGSIYVASKRSATAPERVTGYRYPGGLRLMAMTAAGLYVASVLAFVFGVLRFDIVNAGPPGPDQLGVAVAEFGTHSLTPPVSGSRLGAFVARGLRHEISERPDLTDHVTVLSAPLISSDREARDFAATNGVQLVIWGEVAETEENAFIPSVTLVEPQMYQVWYGELPAWQPVALTGGGSVKLGTTLTHRASGLTDYVMGLIDLSRGNYSQAARELQQAVQQAVADDLVKRSAQEERSSSVSLAHFHLALGRTHEAMGDADRARAEYRSSLQQDPSQGAAHLGLGNIEYSQGGCEDALEAYRRALQANPSLAVAWYSRGNAHFCLGEYADAARDYREALRLSQLGNGLAELYQLVLGVTLCRAGSTEEGIDLLVRASKGGAARVAAAESRNCRAVETVARTTLERTALSSASELPTPAPSAVPPITTVPALAAGPLPSSTPESLRMDALFARLWTVLLRTATPVPPYDAPTALLSSTPSPTETQPPLPEGPLTTPTVTATPTWPSFPTSTPPPTELPLPPSPTKGPNASWTQFPPTAVFTIEPAPTSTPIPPQPTATDAPTWTPAPLPPTATWTDEPMPTASPMPSPLPSTATPASRLLPTATPAPPTPLPPTAISTDEPSPSALPPTTAPTDVPVPEATPLAPTQLPPAPTIPAEPDPTPEPLPSETVAPEPTSVPMPTSEDDKEKPPKPPKPTRRP